jgi:ParB family transcriptional regulator, chromosome partitioning protein
MNRKALGRGLDALIPQDPHVSPSRAGDRLLQIPINQIQPNPDQPRRQFDAARLNELSRSIKDQGVLEPLIVRQREGGSYQLIAGERRLRAAHLAGLEVVPAILRGFEGCESLEVALIENLQREDLNPVDEARAYQRLAEEFDRTHGEISEKVGKDRSTVTNLLRLLRLPGEVLEEVSRGTLSVGHARALLAVEDAETQVRLSQLMIRDGWSVRQAEKQVADLSRRTPASAKSRAKKPASRGKDILRVEESLRYFLGTEVHLVHGPNGGRIDIRYTGTEELERILDLIGVQVH